MIVSVTTELPLPAEEACRLARKPPLLTYVLWPWLKVTPLVPVPDKIAVGDKIAVRLRLFGVLPLWSHTIRIEHLTTVEIFSHEHGGPVRRWDHVLTFEPTSPSSCRYTDTIDIDAGRLTRPVALFAHLIYRYRQARWQALARVLT